MSSAPILRITELSKAFGPIQAVDGLSLELAEGAIFGFLGPNGAGKSTTIRVILSLVRPDTGDVEIFGQSVRKFKNHTLVQVGAFVEEPDFYRNLSAVQNLHILRRLHPEVGAERVREVLELVDLGDRGEDKVKAYSRGMRQRLGIAQALLHKPRLLILDEPTAGLDPAGIRSVRELIVRLAEQEQITVFLSSHILHEVELTCTEVALINHGKLIKTGRVRELLGSAEQVVTELQLTPLEAARRFLGSRDGIRIVAVTESAVTVLIRRPDISPLIADLVAAGVAVQAVIPRTSLEDYYLSLTGEK